MVPDETVKVSGFVRAGVVNEVPDAILETEAAMRIGLTVRAAGYELEVAPRANGSDFAAAREGQVWATFHLDIDRKRPLLVHVGATVWGGARSEFPGDVPWTGPPPAGLAGFIRERLDLACKRGRSQNPDHCANCPNPNHPR